MADKQYPALARYLDRTLMQWSVGSDTASQILALVGFIQFMVGGIALLKGNQSAAFPIIFGIGCCLLACGIGLLIWNGRRRKDQIRLNFQGSNLVNNLYSAANTSTWGCSRSWGAPSVDSILTTAGAEVLEEACTLANELDGLLKVSGVTSNQSLTQLRPAIKEASSQAMFGIMNQLALIQRHPEIADTILSRVKKDVDSLRELSSRVREIQLRQPSITEQLSGTSLIESVLDQLAADEEARRELLSHHDA